jgi:hypothetical protein
VLDAVKPGADERPQLPKHRRAGLRAKMSASMQADRFRFTPHSLGWLLWLALLVPVAQVTATGHGLSHARVVSAGAADEKGAPHSNYCSVCLSAAAITAGGAAISEPARLFLTAIRHIAPVASFASVVLAVRAASYLSRAPPAPLR